MIFKNWGLWEIMTFTKMVGGGSLGDTKIPKVGFLAERIMYTQLYSDGCATRNKYYTTQTVTTQVHSREYVCPSVRLSVRHNLRLSLNISYLF